jgi:hypothetical protein
MELRLIFRLGVLTGEGRDRVGAFTIRGAYTVQDGRCYWTNSRACRTPRSPFCPSKRTCR